MNPLNEGPREPSTGLEVKAFFKLHFDWEVNASMLRNLRTLLRCPWAKRWGRSAQSGRQSGWIKGIKLILANNLEITKCNIKADFVVFHSLVCGQLCLCNKVHLLKSILEYWNFCYLYSISEGNIVFFTSPHLFDSDYSNSPCRLKLPRKHKLYIMMNCYISKQKCFLLGNASIIKIQ